MIVSVMGIFKVEDSDHMHMIPLINVTQSGIRIRFLLDRLVNLLKGKKGLIAQRLVMKKGT